VHRKSKFADCLALLSVTASQLNTPAFAQEAVTKASEDAGNCDLYSSVISKLEGGYVRGLVKSCSNGISDVTTGPNSPPPNEITILSRGRFESKLTPSFLRGLPNTAYLFHPFYLYQLSGRYLYDPKFYPLNSVAHVLPFMPTEIVSLGDLGDGRTGYGYTGLQILPSAGRDAYPLNRDSIVIAIDGYRFVSPAALTAYLTLSLPNFTAIRYVEVVYMQAGAEDQIIRRALIPLYPRARQEPNWSRMAASNSAFSSHRSSGDGGTSDLIEVTALGALIALMIAYNETDAGRAAKAKYDQCMATSNVLSCF